MKNSKLGSCRIKFELFCHAKIYLENQKFPKSVVFWRCGQNDGDYLEYRSSEHDTFFKTFLRDLLSFFKRNLSSKVHGLLKASILRYSAAGMKSFVSPILRCSTFYFTKNTFCLKPLFQIIIFHWKISIKLKLFFKLLT